MNARERREFRTLQDYCANVERVYTNRNKRRQADSVRRRRERISDGICILCIGIGVYIALYGLAAFLQWCATGTWI